MEGLDVQLATAESMMSFRLTACLLVTVTVCGLHVGSANASGCSQNTRLTATQIKQALDAHNQFRREAGSNANERGANMVEMVWDDQLARRAQDWAELCQRGHTLMTDCETGDALGQNLYYAGNVGSNIGSFDVTTFIKAWNDEKQFYTYSSQECKNAAGQQEVCGHYTQVVWAKSVKVGCGIKYCPVISNLGYTNAVVFGCDYTPVGNFNNEHPYVKGTGCSLSQCAGMIQGSGYMCRNNLCAACTPSQHGGQCTCNTLTCQNGGTWNAGQCKCECKSGFYGHSCENPCECIAKSNFCSNWKNSGFCTNSLYRQFMTDNCMKTCDNLCSLPSVCK